MANDLVERNTLIAILCRLTTNPGRDHRSGQEFVVAGSSQEIVDALRQAAVVLRRDNSRIEALERENATLRAEKGKIIEKAALIAEEQADRARELAGHAKASPFPTESVHASCFLTMAGTGRAIAAAIRNMGGEG